MAYEARVKLYEDIERLRERPLIVYSTRFSNYNSGSMSMDSIPEFCEQLLQAPSDSRKVDLLLVSQGGDAIVSWRIINLLRERFEEVDVLVPYVAQSAATVLSFGADHIVMHPFSCLGPIDPQITIQSDSLQTPPKTFSVEDIQAYLEFVKNDLGITASKNSAADPEPPGFNPNVLDHLVKELSPTQIGIVKKSMKLSEGLAEKLLLLHMTDTKQVESIVKKFNTMTHHGYTIGRKEAKESGLPVEYPSEQLEKLMWAVWTDLSSELKCDVPFDPLMALTANPKMSAALANNINTGMPYTLTASEVQKIAVVESKRFSSHYDVRNQILGSGSGVNMSFNVISSALGWVRS